MELRHFVHSIESERGWGCKTWSVEEYSTEKEAKKAVKKVNSLNTSTTVPDWYIFAEYSNDLNLLYSKEYVDKRVNKY